MGEAYMKQPLTPDSFVNNNLATIKKIFPDLVPTTNTPEGNIFIKPEEMTGLIAGLENRVWDTMGSDPAFQMLGRERYNVLPEEQRLKVLEDSVRLLEAAQEADTFLRNETQVPQVNAHIDKSKQSLTSEQQQQRAELWARGKEIVLNAPQLYVDIDVEADGIAGHGSMLAIGAQSPTGESFYSEIKPAFEDFNPSHIEFTQQHGLERERLLAEAPDMQEVMSQFHAWITQLQSMYGKAPVFTAFNAAFDWAFVDLYFLKVGIQNPFGIAPFDLKSLAMPLTNNWNWGETSKKTLPPIIIPDGDFTHHALEDAQYQQKLHFGMVALLEKNKWLKTPNIYESLLKNLL